MAKVPERPWGKIVHIYDRPLREEDITTHFQTSRDVVDQTRELIGIFQGAIDRTVEEMGYKGKKLMTLGTDVRDGQIGARIKQDQEWKQAYEKLIEIHAPGMDLVESANNLTRTDWNAFQFGLLGISFEQGMLRLEAGYSHSYFDTLSTLMTPDGEKKFKEIKKLDPMSVVGFTVTNDGFLPLGYRGGTNFNDTLQYLPAGSVEPHSEKNPLYESQDKENLEEAGFTRERWYKDPRSGLVTMIKDIEPNRSYAIFEQHLDMNLKELIDLWKEKASDRAEHRHLVPLPNDPEYVLEEIKRKPFDFDRASLPLSITSGVNYGAILPQCAIGLLAVYSRQMGSDWAVKAEERLDFKYDLTSWFDK